MIPLLRKSPRDHLAGPDRSTAQRLSPERGARVKENKTRERRIEMEVVVDAYNESERAMGSYYYLEERLKFPFKARCKSKRAVSPLRIGEKISVLGMAPGRN